MKTKKFICILLAAFCALTFAACGGGSKESGQWWTTTGELAFDGEGNVVFEEVDVKLTTVVTGSDKAVLDNIVATFNAAYRGKINIVSTSLADDGFEQTVAQSIVHNSNAPDLIMSHQKIQMSMLNTRLIQPFDEVMEQSGIRFDPADFLEGLSQYAKLGTDKLYGIPVDAQSAVVFYNKEILSRLGETELPATKAQLLALCSRAKEAGVLPVSWSTSDFLYANYIFPTALSQNGAVLYDPDSYKADWADNAANKTAFLDAISAINTMIDSGYAPSSITETSSLNNFLDNQALFYFCSPWDLTSVISAYAAKYAGGDVEKARRDYVGATSMAGWFASSQDSKDANKIFADSHVFSISRSVSDINKKAAICEFIRWFTSNGEVGSKWATAGHISASKKIIESAAYRDNADVKEYLNRFYPDTDNIVCIGNTTYYEKLKSCLDSIAVGALGANREKIDSLILTKQKELNDIIDLEGIL